MKDGIHPTYSQATVTCACGNTFTVGSTKVVIHTEACSACHPFYTGQKKLVDSAGRVERFARMSEKTNVKRATATQKSKIPQTRKESPSPKVRKLG